MDVKNPRSSPKMSGHAPKDALPCGDYYGTGIKNPIGKMRPSSLFGSSDIVPGRDKKKRTPTA